MSMHIVLFVPHTQDWTAVGEWLQSLGHKVTYYEGQEPPEKILAGHRHSAFVVVPYHVESRNRAIEIIENFKPRLHGPVISLTLGSSKTPVPRFTHLSDDDIQSAPGPRNVADSIDRAVRRHIRPQ